MLLKDESLNSKIIKAAKDEFYNKGFRTATLRAIADSAGVTTGAIYTRYKNKNQLFYDICKDAIVAMEEYFGLTEDKKKMVPMIFGDLSLMKEAIFYHSRIILDNADEFELLLFKSDGSQYQGYRNDLMDIYVQTFSRIFYIKGCEKNFSKSADVLFKTLGAFYMGFIEEIIIHKNENDLINEYIDKIARILFDMFKSLSVLI